MAVGQEAVLENVPNMDSKSESKKDTVSTANSSALEMMSNEDSHKTGTKAKHTNGIKSSRELDSPRRIVGNLDVSTVASLILETLDKSEHEVSVPSTPKKALANVSIQSPLTKSPSTSPSTLPFFPSPGKPPRSPRTPKNSVGFGATNKALPRIPRTPRTPKTPGALKMNRIARRSPGTYGSLVSPLTPAGESPSSLATKVCKSSEGAVWHPDFWCADLLDFDQDLPPGSSAEFSVNSRDTDEDDESSVITDISALSNEVAEFLDVVESAPGCSVRFKEIVIREYDQILGVNPACSNGPSITIGWNFKEHQPLRVKHYESLRRRVSRKSKMVLSRKTREKMLSRLGYSDSEIAEATRENNRIRAERRATANSMATETFGKALQNAARKMKNIFSISRRRR